MNNKIEIFCKKKIKISRDRVVIKNKNFNFLFDEINKRLSERLICIKRKFSNILEIGSRTGNGLNVFYKSKDLKTLFASDISKKMLKEAKNKSKNNQKTYFVNVDEERLPFKEKSFDLVYSNLYLHWTNDVLLSFSEIYKVLKPDGLFLASMFGDETLKELKYSLYSAENIINNKVSPRVSPFLRMEDTGNLLQKVGFQLPVIDKDVITIFYKDIFSLMHSLQNMGESNSMIERKKNFTTKKVLSLANDIYLKKFSKKNKIFSTFEILYFIGWAKHLSQPKPKARGSAKKSLADALSKKN